MNQNLRQGMFPFIVGICMLLGAMQTIAAEAPHISLDQQCFTINGKDTFIYSGAFHYFRCPKPLWDDRFAKIKAAGLNTVETYVAWNWNEQQPPADVNDYSKVDLSDLNDWLDLAINKYGLNVMIRPGPYICAEWDGGGYPQWLITKKPANFKGTWFRGDDATYLAWCKHWYTAVAKVVVPWQITHQPAGKPGVILWQLENEYNYDGSHTPEQKLHQLQALAHDSRDLGIDVPLFTCVTEDPLYRQDKFLHDNVWDTRNEYPKYDMTSYVRSIEGQKKYQPDKMLGLTELQGGWFAQVGGKLSDQQGFGAAHITHITLLAWAHGYTSTNYYMMFGGTNFGDWAAWRIITSYDYAAPLREAGGTWDRYFSVSEMGHFIQEHGSRLTRTTLEAQTAKPSSPQVTVITRRSADGSRYVFFFNESEKEPRTGTMEVAPGTSIQYELPPFGAKIFYIPGGTTDVAHDGQWLPKTIDPPQRPTNLPAVVNITNVVEKADPGPQQWVAMVPNGGEEASGIFDRRYLYYRAKLPVIAAGKAVLITPDLHDSLVAAINGRAAASINCGVGHSAFELPVSTSDGELAMLYQNPGRGNGGDTMEVPSGIRNIQIVDRVSLPQTISEWRIKLLPDHARPEVAVDVDDSKWLTGELSAETIKPGETAVFRAALSLTEAQLKAGVTLLTSGKLSTPPALFVNGQPIKLGNELSLHVDLASQLHAGVNLIAVVEKNTAWRGSLPNEFQLIPTGGVSEHGTPLIAELSGEPVGLTAQWWQENLDDSSWSSTPSTAAEAIVNASPTLKWYRLKFELPQADAQVWFPWLIRLDAIGNGLLYLNGHPLGRWWEVGPQKDYYLPECWLNPTGKPNVVTLCLWPTKAGQILKTAQLLPQSECAETR